MSKYGTLQLCTFLLYLGRHWFVLNVYEVPTHSSNGSNFKASHSYSEKCVCLTFQKVLEAILEILSSVCISIKALK